jgi:hypothetical protein
MKILSCALLLMASLAFVLAGCSDNSVPPVTPGEPTLSPASTSPVLQKGGVTHAVSGSAHWKFVAVTGEENGRFTFSAVQHADGSVTGELVSRDKGRIMYGQAKVYGLHVSGNMAKLDFRFTHGNFNTFYAPGVKITDIVGWVIVIDNGEGANANGPDLVSLIVFTEGSDIQPLTIAQLDPMGPEEYLQTMGDYISEYYGIPYEAFLTTYDNGSVHVR